MLGSTWQACMKGVKKNYQTNDIYKNVYLVEEEAGQSIIED